MRVPGTAARMILAVLTKCPGVEPEWVKSVQQAAKRVGEGAGNPARCIGAIVTDTSVLGGTGLDVVAAIRGHALGAAIPILVISANDDPGNAKRYAAAGADGFMSKDDLLQQLPAWIAAGTPARALARAA